MREPIGTNGNGDGRRPDGTFAPGHGHSRKPRKTRAARLRKALVTAITPADMEAIVRKAVADAIAGDPQARQWVSAYAIGKPADSDVKARIEDLERRMRERGALR